MGVKQKYGVQQKTENVLEKASTNTQIMTSTLPSEKERKKNLSNKYINNQKMAI